MSRPVPNNENQRKAVEILRDRGRSSQYVTEEQIQWAVAIVHKWDSDHPLLRYRERQNPVSKPSK